MSRCSTGTLLNLQMRLNIELSSRQRKSGIRTTEDRIIAMFVLAVVACFDHKMELGSRAFRVTWERRRSALAAIADRIGVAS